MQKRALLQLSDNADPDELAHQRQQIGAFESVNTVVYVDEQKMPRSDCRMRKLIWTHAVRKLHEGHFRVLRINYAVHSGASQIEG